jgi:4-amino-4-deoxy-L-arabinose transferase-like glycosyltransferase
VRRWSLHAAALAVVLAAVAAALMNPPPVQNAPGSLAGWPRLIVYGLAGVILAVTAAPVCLDYCLRASGDRHGYVLMGLGVAAAVVFALVNAVRLRTNIADALGPALWIASMLLLLGYSLFPQVRRIGWRPLWLAAPKATRLAWLTLVVILVAAAAVRLVALGQIPAGINPDEGDRASTSLDLLNGGGPLSWFDSGWFFINMVYFRVLATSMAVFGQDVFGGRMLTALTGIAFVGVIAWIGWRNFSPRVGLLAAAFAAATQISIQFGRLITEAGPTALLWAISMGGFLEGTRTGRAWAWVLAGLSGGLGLYFYPSARLWAVGAGLTAVVILAFVRDRRVLPGIGLAAVASVVAVLPFVVHLGQHPEELAGRYEQTAVIDPLNQQRLAYLQPPEPLAQLLALQVERTVGIFDRYPDGGVVVPTNHPIFGPPLAQLALVGAAYVLVRGFRDVRMAVLSVWFWLGLSGVALTVETPNYLRAVGMLPSLWFLLALPMLDLFDRLVPALTAHRGQVLGGALPAVVAVILLVPEVSGYFAIFGTLPGPWAPMVHEGQATAALSANGPVYSMEIDEHLVNSGWVRLLSTAAHRGRVPNPGREVPFLLPVGGSTDSNQQRPNFFADAGQGFSVILAPDPNQRTYLPLLQQLYPQGRLGDGGGDGRQSIEVSSEALDAVDGVTLVDANGATRGVDRFGEIPPDASLPATLTWRGGVRLDHTETYAFAPSGAGQVRLRLDDIPVSEGKPVNVRAAGGVHFVELVADVAAKDDGVGLAIDGAELAPRQTYRLMDAPWGLLARLSQGTGSPSDLRLDSMVSMAFFDPELGSVVPPNKIVWSGTLLAPQDGAYRMAFAAEDRMHLEVDGQPQDVVSVKPEDWRTLGTGSVVNLNAGPHRVQVTLDVTHTGRELARWNWVLPQSSGAMDPDTAWTVVPPQVLRPDPPVAFQR